MKKNRKSNWEGFFYATVWFAALVLAILGISLILEGCGGPAFQSASESVEAGVSSDVNRTTFDVVSEADSKSDSGSDPAFATDDSFSPLSDSGQHAESDSQGESPDSAKADSGPETPICYACGSSACVGTSGGPGTGCGCLVDPHTWQPDQSATAICAYAK